MNIDDLSGLDLNGLMNQAREMQSKMQEAQDRAASQVVTGEAGGGMVTVKVNGKQEVLDVSIDPAVVDPQDIDMLQDLVLAAINVALQRAKETMSNELGPLGKMVENLKF